MTTLTPAKNDLLIKFVNRLGFPTYALPSVAKIAIGMITRGQSIGAVKRHIEWVKSQNEKHGVYDIVAKVEAGKQVNIETKKYTWGLDDLHKGYLVKTGDDQYKGWRGLFYSYDEPPHEMKEFTTTLRGVYDILATACYYNAIITIEGIE